MERRRGVLVSIQFEVVRSHKTDFSRERMHYIISWTDPLLVVSFLLAN